MIEIEDAWARIDKAAKRNSAVDVELHEAVGRVIAASIHSESDSPPFSKSLVDGFAVGSSPSETESYSILEVVTAGNVPTKPLARGYATQIMTGAPIPDGTVGVIMIEETQTSDDQQLVVRSEKFSVGQNILQQGRVVSRAETLVAPGHRLHPHHVGALAEFGIHLVKVIRKTKVAVLVTGDELVSIEDTPGPGQIRNSNGPLIASMANSAGAETTLLGIGRDNESDLKERIAAGLEHDILVIAGGVSAGVLDLVPKCLNESGVEQVFHKVNLKPGKPLWFGTREKDPESKKTVADEKKTLVFGLPGNPVSSLVCFKLFVEPMIRRLEGGSNAPPFQYGSLAEDFEFKGGRRTFWPCRFAPPSNAAVTPSAIRLQPLPWVGSSDQVRFLNAEALVEFNGLGKTFHVGDSVRYIEL